MQDDPPGPRSADRAGAPPGTPRGPGRPAPRPFNDRRVLIVDDDRRGVYALGSALAVRGLTLVHAATGREGISVLRADPEIAAVLLDISMPDLDGYATAAGIRGWRSTATSRSSR
ncbi:PleD family two-component system response regulator [Catenulispora yoronensis]